MDSDRWEFGGGGIVELTAQIQGCFLDLQSSPVGGPGDFQIPYSGKLGKGIGICGQPMVLFFFAAKCCKTKLLYRVSHQYLMSLKFHNLQRLSFYFLL